MEEMSSSVVFPSHLPNVYWAQTGSLVTLRVDLRSLGYFDENDVFVDIQSRRIGFEASNRRKAYKFDLDFYGDIDSAQYGDIVTTPDEMVAKLKRRRSDEKKPNRALEFLRISDIPAGQSAYLFFYNCTMMLGYALLFLQLLIEPAFFSTGYNAWNSLNLKLKLLTVISFVELVHVLMGIKGTKEEDYLVLFTQIFVRRFGFLFVIFDQAISLRQTMLPYWIFLIWTLLDIARYSYCAFAAADVAKRFLIRLRYVYSLPLELFAWLCEVGIVVHTLGWNERTKDVVLRFSAFPALPPVQFHLFLCVYLIVGLIPGGSYQLYRYAKRAKRMKRVIFTQETD